MLYHEQNTIFLPEVNGQYERKTIMALLRVNKLKI